MNKRYTESQLKRALDMVEEGYSFSDAAEENNLNKSIVAREMRKRKNAKARQQVAECVQNYEQESLSLIKEISESYR